VRELRNFVERTYILSPKDTVGKEDLPPAILYETEEGGDDLSLESVIRKHILRVLDITGGNKKKAADLLGIDRSTLYARLRSYGRDTAR